MTPEGSLFDARPDAFGSYRVLDEMGPGRFGPVYRAQAPGGQVVAVKVFEQGLTPAQTAALVDALTRLCQIPLDHAAIVAPVAAGLENKVAWMAEPYVEGTPLDRAMRRDGPQPLADVLLRITRVAGALDFAAAAGIHHGALHPRDIIVSDDTTVLTGLGVVQALAHAGLDVPVEGAYVSPQRALGSSPVARDDIYALAAITFELVYGQPVPERTSLRDAMTRLTGVDQVRFREVIEGSLSEDPGDRPATALEFAAALQRVIVDHDIPMPIPHSRSEVAISADDLPLRVSDAAAPAAAEPEPPPLPDPAPAVQVRAPFASTLEPAPRERGGHWFGFAAGLAIGILMGFGAGFVTGQRDATPEPRAAERVVPRNRAVEERPAPTAGSDFTESEVAAPATPQRIEEPEPTPVDRADPPRTARSEPQAPPERAEPIGRPERLAPAALQVDSRPRGARVFLDGRLVGTTPLNLADVTPGTHAVRIDLTGYRRWVTTVNVTAGARARVAASLER